jgi:hypothetical protein
MRPLFCAVALVCATAAPARAGLFELYGQLSAGGGFGRGTAGAGSKDFFEAVQGGAFGGEVGVEILYVDVFVDHYQFFTDKRTGTWTQFMLGLDASFPMDDDHSTEATIGFDAGLGVGTIGDKTLADPNLSNNVSTRGLVSELRLQGDRLLGKYASFGLDLRVGYHYLFDANQPINLPNDAGKSQGMQLFGGVAFKLHFGTD